MDRKDLPDHAYLLPSQAEVDAFKAEHAKHNAATTPQLFAGSERIGGYTGLTARLRWPCLPRRP